MGRDRRCSEGKPHESLERHPVSDAGSTVPAIAEAERLVRRLIPFFEQFDWRIESLGETLRISMPLEGSSVNHFGGMHAAVLFAAAESLGGLAVLSIGVDLDRHWCAVREVTIRYRKPAMSDVRAAAPFGAERIAAARAELAATGKASFVLDAQVLDQNGAVVAETTASYHLRRRDPAAV